MFIVKLGGSLITYKSSDSGSEGRWDERRLSYRVREEMIRSLGMVMKNHLDKGLIIIHGGGTHGHRTVKRWRDNIARGKDFMMPWEVRWRMAQLTENMLRQLGSSEVPAVEISTNDIFTMKGGSISDSYPTPIMRCIERGAVPMLKGDLVTDDRGGWSVLSGDELAVELARLSRDGILPELEGVAMCMEAPGILRRWEDVEEIVGMVSQRDFHEYVYPGLKGGLSDHVRGCDESGGILGKALAAHKISSMGYPVNLIGGESLVDDLDVSLRGKYAGTTFHPFDGDHDCMQGRCIERLGQK